MFQAQARWFLLAGLSNVALLACGGEEPAPSGTAGTSSGGSAGGQVGGSSGAGTSAGGMSGGAAGSMSAGIGGGGMPGGGMPAGGMSGGGTGGAAGAAGSGGSGGAGGAVEPTAVANITGLNGQAVTGTATFTQGATMTKLVLNLTACPNGVHASHLHANKDCGNEGVAAGNHWVPNGENLGDYTCANSMGMHEVSKPTTVWTVGGSEDTDVTQFSFMVHEMGGDNPGGRIGCGVIDVKP